MANEQPQRIVVTSTKSMGIAILLTILFGPLGMLYVTIPGALIMMACGVVLGLLTFGIALLIIWPASIVWAAMATNSYNKKLLSGVTQA